MCFPCNWCAHLLFFFFFYLQETDVEKVVEVKNPRRGRSSRTSAETEKDQLQEPEIVSLSPGERCSEAATKEAAAGKICADVVSVKCISLVQNDFIMTKSFLKVVGSWVLTVSCDLRLF